MSDNSDEIEVLEWIYVERQGEKKDGTNNNQLELGRSRLSIKETLHRLVLKLETCRELIFCVLTNWRNIAFKKIIEQDDETIINDCNKCIFLVIQ